MGPLRMPARQIAQNRELGAQVVQNNPANRAGKRDFCNTPGTPGALNWSTNQKCLSRRWLRRCRGAVATAAAPANGQSQLRPLLLIQRLLACYIHYRQADSLSHDRPMPHVGLFIPCYVDQLYPRVGMATVELLERFGCTVDFPEQQTCCGDPPAATG